ncbi:MAG: c-type cytochrome [Deltaproteobacteria bacterium]|nr:c-type cytochrome [Deltaproteobacteria bacterium]
MTPARSAIALVALLVGACSNELYREDIDGSEADVPASYRNLQNPYRDNVDAATVGQILYDARCVSCHGDTGRGDGPQGVGMVPPPTDFVAASLPTEGYLFWKIREGGEPVGSEMPAYRGQLEDGQIWEIVSYLRLFYEEEPLYR